MFARTPPVVRYILIINIIVLILTQVFGDVLYREFALHYFGSSYFKPHQFITHMFMHGGITHLFFNMLMLWMFGRILEQVWGSKRFLTYYMVTGIGAALLHTFVNYLQLGGMMEAANLFLANPNPELYRSFIGEYISKPRPEVYDFLMNWEENPSSTAYINAAITQVNNFVVGKINIPTVGASGAVFGVLLAFGMLFPNTELMLIFLPFFPIKAKYMVILMAAVELMLGLSMPGSNIAHFAHLGGMIFGFFLIRYWKKNNRMYY